MNILKLESTVLSFFHLPRFSRQVSYLLFILFYPFFYIFPLILLLSTSLVNKQVTHIAMAETELKNLQECKTIGIIGLGDMGYLYAKRFSDAGWKVVGCDRKTCMKPLKQSLPMKSLKY